MFAFWGHVDMVSKLDKKLWFIANEAKERFNVTMRPMNAKHFREEVEMFLRVYNASMVGTWGFAPLSAGEIKELAAGLKYLIAPELALVAEIDGEPIGACLGLLDYNPRIKAIDGRLFPFGFLKLIAQQARHQEDARHQHQRRPRVPTLGPGRRAAGRPDRADDQMGHAGSRVLLGTRIEHALARAAWKKGAPSSTRPIACTTTIRPRRRSGCAGCNATVQPTRSRFRSHGQKSSLLARRDSLLY